MCFFLLFTPPQERQVSPNMPTNLLYFLIELLIEVALLWLAWVFELQLVHSADSQLLTDY